MAQFGDQELHTFKKFAGTFRDSIHNGGPALAAMRRHGAIKQIDVAGTRIVPTVLKDETSNITHFRGKARISHTAEEPLDAPSHKWYYFAYKGALAVTDVLENRGKQQIINRVDGELKKARIYLADRFNKNVVKLQSTNATDFGEPTAEIHDGIPDIVFAHASTNDSINTLGGIDRSLAANSWYRNEVFDITNSNVLANMNLLLMNSTRNGVRPGVWLNGKNAYNLLGALLNAKFVINQPTSARPIKFQAGFSGLMMDGAEMVWDHEIVEDQTIGDTGSGQGVAYGMSTEFWNYVEGKPWVFEMLPWKKPDGGSEIMAQEFTILAARSHYHELPRTCGVAFGITA